MTDIAVVLRRTNAQDLADARAEIERLRALADDNHKIIWELSCDRERLRAFVKELHESMISEAGNHYLNCDLGERVAAVIEQNAPDDDTSYDEVSTEQIRLMNEYAKKR